jgi:hypothetical protein
VVATQKGLPLELSEAFLLDQIPLVGRASIPTAIKQAYVAAGLIIEKEPILSVESAKANRGRIIQWAVDLAFEKLVESGQFGIDRRWRFFERPTGRYLEILFSHSVLTISQVADPTKQPRDVAFRRNKRLASQISMEFMREETSEWSGVPHILLLHGHQTPDFAYLAIPQPLHGQGFQHRSPNLMLMAHPVPHSEVPMEETDVEAVMTLKEEIDRLRRDER